MQARKLIRGHLPILISMPHTASFIPSSIKERMTTQGLNTPDADWHIDTLYDFAREMGASMLYATHSRYVVDLNRDPVDTDLYPGQVKTGICPLQTFSGEDIYKNGEEPDAIERVNRIAAYWQPYHEALAQELAVIKKRYGFAILYDAHSIASRLPRLFEGRLPDLNLGTVHGKSCAEGMAQAALEAAKNSGYSHALNGRFIGGYITRHYGDPDNGIHALQMELAQENYMNEAPPFTYDTIKAAKLQIALKSVIAAILAHF